MGSLLRVPSTAVLVVGLAAAGCAPTPPPAPAPVVSPAVPAGCALSPAASVPEMIGVLWRCELTAAGLGPAETERLVADAVTVAACESAWNPSAVAYAGRYVDTPNPVTGAVHTAAGVFQLRRGDADRFVPGGYAAALDPAANIVGAARLFLAGYTTGGRAAGFAPWPCASGPEPVLPGLPGGPPSLPSWADLYCTATDRTPPRHPPRPSIHRAAPPAVRSDTCCCGTGGVQPLVSAVAARTVDDVRVRPGRGRPAPVVSPADPRRLRCRTPTPAPAPPAVADCRTPTRTAG